jgi:hypothetical protein
MVLANDSLPVMLHLIKLHTGDLYSSGLASEHSELRFPKWEDQSLYPLYFLQNFASTHPGSPRDLHKNNFEFPMRYILFFIHLFTCAYIVWVISPPCLPPPPSPKIHAYFPITYSLFLRT